MDKLMEKIKKHPRSHVARAYKLGLAHSNDFMPLLKISIRYFVMKGRYPFSRREANEITRLKDKILELTK